SESTPAIPFALSTSDSLKVQASEGVPTVNTGASSIAFITAAESITLFTSEAPGILVTLTVTDTFTVQIAPLGFGEDISIFGFVPQQFVSLSVVDTCVVQVITP